MQAGSLKICLLFCFEQSYHSSGSYYSLVFFTLQRAFQERFDKHKKLARITWPLWFYVAVTGVIVYVMISPYYA